MNHLRFITFLAIFQQVNFELNEMMGSIVDDGESLDLLNNKTIKSKMITVQCFPLYSILLAVNRTQIDFFSLDVEGFELQVLTTIPWHKVAIKVTTL